MIPEQIGAMEYAPMIPEQIGAMEYAMEYSQVFPLSL